MRRRAFFRSLAVAGAGLVLAAGLSAKEATVTLTITGMT
jgi:hypothetical protein